jgi:hypothetical protein
MAKADWAIGQFVIYQKEPGRRPFDYAQEPGRRKKEEGPSTTLAEPGRRPFDYAG